MSEEEIKKLCKEEFLKNIKENIKSGTIFTYVDGLEKENNKQKEVLDKIKKYILEHCEIILHEEENTTEVGKVDGKKLLELLEEIEWLKYKQ